jgi:hypothetical protein
MGAHHFAPHTAPPGRRSPAWRGRGPLVRRSSLRLALLSVLLATPAAEAWQTARIEDRIDNAEELLRGCERRRALLAASAAGAVPGRQDAADGATPASASPCELAAIDARLRRVKPAVWALHAPPGRDVLFATVNLPYPGLLVSRDDGESWHWRHLFVHGYNRDRPLLLRGLDARDGLLAVASEGGILLSRDGGFTFTTALEGRSFTAVVISPFCSRVLVAGGDATSVVSLDGGATWSELGFSEFVRDLRTTNRHLVDHITSLEFDPASPERLYVGTGSHLYRLALDGPRGRRWQAMEGTAAGRVHDDSTVYNIAIGERFLISTCNGVYFLRRDDADLAGDQARVEWGKFRDRAFAGRGVGGPKGNLRSYFVSEDPDDPGRILVADFAGLYEGRSEGGAIRWRRVSELPYYSAANGYPEYTAIAWTRGGDAVVGSRYGGIFVQRPERAAAEPACFLR